MITWTKPIYTAALAGLVVLGLTLPAAHGQFTRGVNPGVSNPLRSRQLGIYAPGVNPNMPFYNPLNPVSYVAPGVSTQAALISQVQQGRAIASVPPWVYGYNPYPSPIYNNGPMYSNPYGSTPYSPPMNPYAYAPPSYPGAAMSNPYGGGYGGGGAPMDPSNPYGNASMGSGYNPYSSSTPPYGTDPTTGYLYGYATGMRATGQLYKDLESARLMRETALQAQLVTKKQKFDLQKYIEENTPTYTQVQAKIAATTLERIRGQALPGEIQSGKAMNILLKDIGKQQGRRAGIGSLPLEEDVLRRLNVTTPNGGNLGLLRDDGQFIWPAAMTEVATTEQLRDVQLLAKVLSRQAADGNVKPNQVRDLESTLDKMRTVLLSKVNEIRTPQYLEAKRFLNDFDAAVLAMNNNVAPKIHEFYRFVRGGKSVQEVADYMLTHGLIFAPATSGDEGSYQAMHTALANYDIQLNAGVGVAQR